MNTNTKIFLGFLVIIVSIYFLLHKKKRNPYRNIDDNHKILENFQNKTASGKECLPWKDAVNFTEYGDSRKCRNPEKDVNGNWCYTDSYGNYEYCDSFDPSCMPMKVLEGCFTPDKNGYQLVIYNSQPFNDKYLEIDQIADSVNNIWVLDQSGRFLRTAKKSKYLNFTWDEHINDSFNNYDVGRGPDQVYNITGMGVKLGGFKVKSEDGPTVLAGSEVCYLFLKNNTDLKRNRMITCLSSEKVNIQGDKDKDYLQLEWKNDDLRNYINLSKKIDITRKDMIISIHREKMKNTKGIHWGDLVFGKNDRGIVEFSSVGNTFPNSRFYDNSVSSETEETGNTRKYTSVSSKDFFSPGTLYFTHKIFNRLNQQVFEKSDEAMDIILGYLNGKVEDKDLEPGEKDFLNDFKLYLKFRILLNDDYRFKEDNELFTYSLKNENDKLNDYFKNDDLYGLLNAVPVIQYKKLVENKKELLQILRNEYDPSFLASKLDKIDKNLKEVKTLEKLNYGGADRESYTQDAICLKNLKYSTRKEEDFNSSVSLAQQIDGVLEQIKDIPMTGKNSLIKKKLKGFKNNFNRSLEEFRDDLLKTETSIKFNETINYLAELSKIFNSNKTSRSVRNKYIENNFGIIDPSIQGGVDTSYTNKKLIYRTLYKMMDYYKSNVKDLYHNILIRVEALKEIIKRESKVSDTSSTYYKIMNSQCHIEKEIYPASRVMKEKVITHKTRQESGTDESNRFTNIRIRNLATLGDVKLRTAKEKIENLDVGKEYFKYFKQDDINPEIAQEMTLYLKNDLRDTKYQLSHDESPDNNYLFTYKLTYDIDTGIIKEFKHVYLKDDDTIDESNTSLDNKSDLYGLPGFYTKTIRYLSQDELSNKRYKIMVFDNDYNSIIHPSQHLRGSQSERTELQQKFESTRGDGFNKYINFFGNNVNWSEGRKWNDEIPNKILGILTENDSSIFNFSINDDSIKEEVINTESLEGKDIYKLQSIIDKEDQTYFRDYDINFRTGYVNNLYKSTITSSDDSPMKFGIFYSKQGFTDRGRKWNESRVPKMMAFKDSEFKVRVGEGTSATLFYQLFTKIRTARQNYINKIVELEVNDVNNNVQILRNITQGYINKRKILIAEEIKGSLTTINHHIEPHPEQSVSLVDQRLKDSLDNLKELQKPETKIDKFDKKQCVYKYNVTTPPPPPTARNFNNEIETRLASPITYNVREKNADGQVVFLKQYYGLDPNKDRIYQDEEDIEAYTPQTYRQYPNGYYSREWKWSCLDSVLTRVHHKWGRGGGSFHHKIKEDGIIDLKSPNGEFVYFTGIRTLGRADGHNQYLKKFDVYYSIKDSPSHDFVKKNEEPNEDWILIKKDIDGNTDGQYTDSFTKKKIPARYNLNVQKFEDYEDLKGKKFLGKWIRIVGRDKNKIGEVNFKCDFNFKYAHKKVYDYKKNVKEGDIEYTDFISTARKNDYRSYDGAEHTSLIDGPGYYSDKWSKWYASENGRWKSGIVMSSKKPVFFTGVRIQGYRDDDGNSRHSCKKFNIYCSEDNVNFNKIVSEKRIKFEQDDEIWTDLYIDDFYEDERSNFSRNHNDGRFGRRNHVNQRAVIKKPLKKVHRYIIELKEDVQGWRDNGDITFCNNTEIRDRTDDTRPSPEQITKSDTEEDEQLDKTFSNGDSVWFACYKDKKWKKGEIVKEHETSKEATDDQPAGYLVDFKNSRGVDEDKPLMRILLAENVSTRGRQDYTITIPPTYGRFIRLEAYEPTNDNKYTAFRCDYNFKEAFQKDDTDKTVGVGFEGMKNFCDGKFTEDKRYCVIYNLYRARAITGKVDRSGHIDCRQGHNFDIMNCGETHIFEVKGEGNNYTFKNVKNQKYLALEVIKENGEFNNPNHRPGDYKYLFYADESLLTDYPGIGTFELVKYQRTLRTQYESHHGNYREGYFDDLKLVGINAKADHTMYRDLSEPKQNLYMHSNGFMYHQGKGGEFIKNDSPNGLKDQGFVIIPMERIPSHKLGNFRRKYVVENPFPENTKEISYKNPNGRLVSTMREIKYHELEGEKRIIDSNGNFVDVGKNILDKNYDIIVQSNDWDRRSRGAHGLFFKMKPDLVKVERKNIEESKEYKDHKKIEDAEKERKPTKEVKTEEIEERNCFMDFVTQEVINIDKIKEIMESIAEKGKHKTYKFTLKVDEIMKGNFDKTSYTPEEENSEFLLPEVAQFLSDIQIIISSIRRNEELLRHNSTFFYKLDDLLEAENTTDTFTDTQWEDINDILHLFFDQAILDSVTHPPSLSIGNREISRPAEHLDKFGLEDNFTVEHFMYEMNLIKKLFHPDLDLYIKRANFDKAEALLTGSEGDCGIYYKNKEILNTLERKEFFLKDLYITFINNEQKINIPSFSRDTQFNNLDGIPAGDMQLLGISCGSLKRNYITKYMINNVRDSLPVLKEGTLNPGNVVDETLKQLSAMDEDLSFDIVQFIKNVHENYNSVKNNFNTNKQLLYNVLDDKNRTYDKLTNYLAKKEQTVPKLLFGIKQEFEENFNTKNISLLSPSVSTEELFERTDIDIIKYDSVLYTRAFNSFEIYIRKLRKHLIELDGALKTSFPSFKLLEYVNFLGDFEKYKELDVIRKTEIIEECLKIFGEINNLANHNSLDLGVIDYNLTHNYIYVDYLFPSKSKDVFTDDSSITKYDWENSTKVIESLNLVSVRLKRDYLEELYKTSEISLSSIIYTSINGNVSEPPRIGGRRGNLFETDIEGKEESELRMKINVGRNVITRFRKEYNQYLPLEKSDQYDKLFKLLYFKELKEEIDRNKFVEQGRIFVKQSDEANNKNKLQIYLKEYDLGKSSNEQLLDYNKYVNSGLIADKADITSTNVRYLHDYSNKEGHPNLYDTGAKGTPDDRMIYQIDPNKFTSGTSVYGIMNYNFSNSLNNAETKIKKQLDNVYFKKKVFFQIYGKQLNSNDIGPIELVNKSELNYILTPEIKYTHGIIFNPDGTIKLNKSGIGALAWFFKQDKDGAFLNVDEWLPYYKTLKAEGMYFLGANPEDLGLDSTRKFGTMFNDYLQSLKNNRAIGKISNETKELLKGLKSVGSNYDKEKKIEKSYPQIKLDRLMSKKYSNQVFVEAIEFKNEDAPVDKKVLALVLDTDDRKEKIKSDYLENKLVNQVNYQDKKNGEPFKYEYYKLKMVNKLDLLMNNDFCEASGKKNKYNTLWRYKVIKNYNDYKLLVEGTEVRDEASLRVKGLYDIHDSLKDDNYYSMIELKFQEMKNLTLKNTLKIILENKKKNMFKGSGYPFMVIYQVRDYQGYICQEGSKNSQKIFLTYELGNKLEYVDKGDSGALNLIDQPKGPIISEEFLSYTGHGATIRFCFQKMKGSTPIEVKGVCSSNESDYSALPGFSDDCTAGTTCGDSVLGLTRLDGTPKCELDDNEVKRKPLGPMDVSVPGNVPLDACDIYKVKGNKRVKYKVGKMFGYNDDGKYQLNNQYTLQYGNYYFRYDAKTKAISLEEELSTDPNEICSYAFNMTIAQDKYGPYLLLNPHNGIKDPSGDTTEFLTRVINIFDKHFDAWKVEPKMDKSSEDKNHVRDRLKNNNNLDAKWDSQYYAQKFNLPEDILMKIANEEGIKSELIEKLKGDLEKGNYLFCNLSGPAGGICKGDFDAKPSMTLDEENELLRQQATQITTLMKRFDNIPHTYFTKYPENEQLMNYMKNTMNTIKKAREFVYKRVQDVNWVVKTQLKTNSDANKLKSNNKKLSLDNIEEQQPMGDLIDESNIMANALKDLQQIKLDNQREPKQCRSIEGFDNMNSPAPSEEKLSKYDRNMSGRYYNYVKDEIGKKKQNISDLNDKIHKLLTQLNTMSDGMDLSGEKKQMLLSEMIQEKNKLEKMIFDIKNYEQQDRIYRINEKLQKVEDIRGEMEENDFRTQKPTDDVNNVSVISREDGELLNMYRINKNNNPDHLLFLNGGCLQYDADKKDISIQHCEANLLEQQFNVFRVEDRADMDKFKIRNAEQGMDRPFGIVMTKDNKCLHKENGEISVRNCDNVKNQYWDYSNITGPCNGN